MSNAVKWTVPKEMIEKALKLIDNVPTRNGIKSSEFIKVSPLGKEAATMSLSSDIAGKVTLKTGAEYPFSEELYLDRRLFMPFINQGKESKTSDYLFIEKDNQLIVKHGQRKAVYAKAKEVSGYEEPGKLEKAAIAEVSKTWTNLVDVASTCATPDPITPTINCVYLKQNGEYLEALSTNGTIVFLGKVKVDKKFKSEIAFPLSLVDSLTTEGAAKLVWTDKLAVIEYKRGRIWAAVKSKARKSFPHEPIRKMVGKVDKSRLVVEFNASSFARAVGRLLSYIAPIGVQNVTLEIHVVKGDKKVVVAAGPPESRFTETVYALNVCKFDVQLEWPMSQVMPVILYSKDAGSIRVHQDDNKPSAFVTNELTMIIGRSE